MRNLPPGFYRVTGKGWVGHMIYNGPFRNLKGLRLRDNFRLRN